MTATGQLPVMLHMTNVKIYIASMEARFDEFLALVLEIESQDARFNDFLALAPEVQKSRKAVPGSLI